MELLETGGPVVLFHGLGAITTVMALPVSVVFTVAALFGFRRAKVDAHVAGVLDVFLARDAEALAGRQGRALLDFRTSESVPGAALGVGLGRVRVRRTILAALRDGYRVRLRAFAEGARGRVIVRMLDVDLRADISGRKLLSPCSTLPEILPLLEAVRQKRKE